MGKGIMLGPKTALIKDFKKAKNFNKANIVMPTPTKTVKLEIELEEKLGKEFLDCYRTNKLDFHYKCVGVGIKRVRLVESKTLIIFNFIKKILSWPIRFWEYGRDPLPLILCIVMVFGILVWACFSF